MMDCKKIVIIGNSRRNGKTFEQLKNLVDEYNKIVEQLAAAKVELAELKTKLMLSETSYENLEEAMIVANEKRQAEKERAEASCAAMRLRFEKYVRENCKLIRHCVADGLEKPDDVEGKCGGYCQNFDEPHQICQECVAAYDPEAEHNEEFADAGTAILADNKRMREVLRRLIDESERIYLAKSEDNTDLPHLAMAIQLAQAALDGRP